MNWGDDITQYWPTITSEVARYQLCKGDLVIAIDGALVGRSYAVISDADLPSLLLQRVARIRASQLNQDLLAFLVANDSFVNHVDAVKTHTAIPHISPEDIRSFLIAVPTNTNEQRAIAEALSDVDGLLAALEALVAKKRAIKQAAMQKLLTSKTRLPGFSGVWDVKPLGDLGHWRGGLTPRMSNRSYWLGGTVPWLSSSDVRQGRIKNVSAHITKQAIAETSVPLIPPNSVIVVIRSGILRRFLPVARCSRRVAINQDLRALHPGMHHDPGFLVHALIGLEHRLLLECLKARTTVESIDSAWFRGFKIPMPSIDEQEAIAAVLSDMDSEIAALERRRDKTRAIKQGMMQQLLTGRVRLVIPE